MFQVGKLTGVKKDLVTLRASFHPDMGLYWIRYLVHFYIACGAVNIIDLVVAFPSAFITDIEYRFGQPDIFAAFYRFLATKYAVAACASIQFDALKRFGFHWSAAFWTFHSIVPLPELLLRRLKGAFIH